jgi:PilZ domain
MGSEQRNSKRRVVLHGARLARSDGAPLTTCRMIDLSASGARLELKSPEKVPDHFLLLLSRDGSLRRHCAVVWRAEASIGVEFIPALPTV